MPEWTHLLAICPCVRIHFDRGTLILDDWPMGIDPKGLPGIVWDARVGCHRAPAFLHRDLIAEFSRREIPCEDFVRPKTRPSGRWEVVDLRPYQAAAMAAWQVSHRRGLIVLPTGSGKTRLALATLAALNVPSLCIVPTRVMMSQWQIEIRKVYGGSVAMLGDGSHQIGPITVATFESAYRHMNRMGDQFGLLIVDEAHHFGSGLRDEALEMCTAAYRLGLTATPPHTPAAVLRIEQLIGPAVYELTLGDLTGRFLAPFDLLTLTVPFTQEDREVYQREETLFRPFFREFFRRVPFAGWQDLCREACRAERGRLAMAAWRRARRLIGFHRAKAELVRSLLERHRKSRVLVFTASNEAAYSIAMEHLIMPITCDISREERQEALEMFASGKLHALVSSQVLNEGIDVPDADVAIIVGGTGAEREHVQRVGRLLRPAPGKRATVYELITRETPEVRQAQRRRRKLMRGVPADVDPTRALGRYMSSSETSNQ